MTPEILPADDVHDLPPLYRSEGFAEDLTDGSDAAAAPQPAPLGALGSSVRSLLLSVIPVMVALLGAGMVSGS